MTNSNSTGAHRPEVTGTRPLFGLGRSQNAHDGGTRAGGEIRMASWRAAAAGARADAEIRASYRASRQA